MSRIFLPFYFNNDTSLCYRTVLNQTPFLIKELMSKKTASVFTDREEPLKKAIFKVLKKQRGGKKKLHESEVKPRETGSQNEVLTTEAQN